MNNRKGGRYVINSENSKLLVAMIKRLRKDKISFIQEDVENYTRPERLCSAAGYYTNAGVNYRVTVRSGPATIIRWGCYLDA